MTNKKKQGLSLEQILEILAEICAAQIKRLLENSKTKSP